MPDRVDSAGDHAGAGDSTGAGDSAGRSWARTRQSFSCTEQVWADAKAAWSSVRREYLAWTQWLEAALALKAAAVRTELGRDVLDPAPDRLPTGRRVVAEDAQAGRTRRAFTCAPEVWAQARAAWWAQTESYPALSDWIEEAITEMTTYTTERTTGR